MASLKEGDWQLSGTVLSKTPKSSSVQYLLKDVSMTTDSASLHGVRAILYAADEGVPIGAHIQSMGKVSGFLAAANDGNFDAALYYRSQKILFQQFSDRITVVSRPLFAWQEALYRIRSGLGAGIRASLPPTEAGVLSAMLLGDKSQLDQDVKTAFQEGGISHILAISGLHISILGMAVFGLLRKRLRFSYPVCFLICGGLVFAFVVMSGMAVSSMRAMIMFFFYMLAGWKGRGYDSLTALLYAAALLLLANPLAIMQAGFLLSFGAVLSIALILPLLRKGLPMPAFLARLPKGEDWFSSALLSLAVWIGLTPLTAALFYQVPLYSLLLNLLLVPFCPLLLADGLAGGLLGTVWPRAGTLVMLPAHGILRLFFAGTAINGSAPGHALLTGHIPAGLVMAYYGALVFAGLFLQVLSGSALSGRHPARHRKRGLLILPCLLLALVLINPSPGRFRVDFLDVGQGDGICISTRAGRHVMIDGGSTSEDQVGQYRILPFLRFHRIGRVDAWIVTHTDADHINGIQELLEKGYPVTELLVSEASLSREKGNAKEGDGDREMEALLAAAKKNGTRVRTVSAGAVLSDPDLTMTCLYPQKREAIFDKNDLSQVWLLEHTEAGTGKCWRFLFTGDLGQEAEGLLCDRGLLSDIDVLKVGHHGSNYSSSSPFLDALRPEFAIISVGKNNRYHHPGKEAVSRLTDCGSRIFATMDLGQITIFEKKGKMLLKSHVR